MLDVAIDQAWESEIIDAIRDARTKRKGYASFFDWPDKPVKEHGVVCDLLESIEAEGGHHGILKLRSHQPDPPDCVGTAASGERIAFEVTELVDQDTIKRNRRGENVWKEWTQDELLLKIEGIVRRKDSKTLHGGPYSKVVLVIHTDEPLLRQMPLGEILRDQKLFPCQKITDAYLLLSYQPGRESYPFFRLEAVRRV